MNTEIANPLDAVLGKFTQSAVAARLGISPQAVQQWEYIPAKWALEIEHITDGEISARDVLEFIRSREKSE